MSEQTFKSANFYDREVDLSGPVTTGPVGVPAAVVGTTNKGPAFIPVTVASFNEFIEKFGNLDPKHFGPYAANEFLKHRRALTFVRVLGAGSNSTDNDLLNTSAYGIVKNAGFKLAGSTVGNGDLRHNGTVQFLVARHDIGAQESGFPMFTDNDTYPAATNSSFVNLVRGAIMTTNTSRVMITTLSTTPTAYGTNINDYCLPDSDGKFKIVISSSLGSSFGITDKLSGVRILTASFDPTDKDYFAKVLNTDPDKFYQEQHYLHTDFAVDNAVASVRGSSCPVAIVSGSANQYASRTFREIFGSFDTRYSAPSTTYFISQPFGKTEHDLFKFEAIDDGEYANSLYKISISNVKGSVNEAYQYGTFNVQIRDWNDTDTSPNVIEQFTNCSLDPNAQNYIAKMIGDRKVYYNFDVVNQNEKRIVAEGKYPNNSRFVRVVMANAVENGLIPQNALPFGFRGPALLNTTPVLKSNENFLPADSKLGGQLASTALSLTGSFLPPVPFRFKATRGEVNETQAWIGQPGAAEQANPAYYWGVKFERVATTSTSDSRDVLASNSTNEKNGLLASFTKFSGIGKLTALTTGSASDTINNNKFTLANVALYNDSVDHLTSSVNTHMREAAYVRNARLDSTKYTFLEGGRSRLTFATLLATGSATFNRFSSYAKFTNFMYGGFDGTNFLNRDARRLNDKSVSFDSGGGAAGTVPVGFSTNPSGNNVYNNGVKSYLTAVDIVTNPMESNNNIVAVPGIRETYINDEINRKVRDYGMAMHVMDIPSYDDSDGRIYDDSIAKPNIVRTTTNFDNRVIDNNYVATYYPDVFIDDATNRRKVKVPASVAALGALAFNDKISYPWFAPAGFNRAALDFVSNVTVRLNVSDRDRLYESRINPIASFPKLGFVIYGQKTLQINRSALDRVNVRRLMLEIKRIIAGLAQKIIFEQNTAAVRNKFVADASFQLGLIQTQAGVEAYQVIMNETNNTQEDADLNRLNGRIVVVPTRVIEYIAVDFIITNSGVQFV